MTGGLFHKLSPETYIVPSIDSISNQPITLEMTDSETCQNPMKKLFPREREGFCILHELHGLDDTLLDAEPGVLDAAEGTALDPVAGHLVDVGRARAQVFGRLQRRRHVVGDNAGRQPEVAPVVIIDRIVQVTDRNDRRKRPEGLLGNDLGFPGDVGEYRRLHQGAPAASPQQDLGPVGHRKADHLLKVLRGRLVDDGAHPRVRVLRVTGDILPRLLHKAGGELLQHGLLHQDALHRGAALPRVAEAPLRGKGDRPVHVRVLQHDERRVAAQFKAGLLVAGGPGNVLADGHRAGEGHHLDPFVGDHRGDHLVQVAGKGGEHPAGQAGLVKQFGEAEGGQRRLLGGLEQHRRPRGNGRGDLVGHLVERVVERGDGADKLDGLPEGDDLAVLALWGDVAGEDLAVVLEGLDGGELHDVGAAPGLIHGLAHAEPGLAADELCQLPAVLGKQGGGLPEDGVALVA